MRVSQLRPILALRRGIHGRTQRIHAFGVPAHWINVGGFADGYPSRHRKRQRNRRLGGDSQYLVVDQHAYAAGPTLFSAGKIRRLLCKHSPRMRIAYLHEHIVVGLAVWLTFSSEAEWVDLTPRSTDAALKSSRSKSNTAILMLGGSTVSWACANVIIRPSAAQLQDKRPRREVVALIGRS